MVFVKPFQLVTALTESFHRTMDDAAGMLRITTEHIGSAVLLRVHGEIDASNVAIWQRMLSDAASEITAGPLVVDATYLDFMAGCAYAVLAEQAALCSRRGVKLCLVSDQPVVNRIVVAIQLESELSVSATVEAALDGLNLPKDQQRPADEQSEGTS